MTTMTQDSDVQEELREEVASALVAIALRDMGLPKEDSRDRGNDSDNAVSVALETKMHKLRKILRDQSQELEALSTDELKERIVQSEQSLHENEQLKNRDTELHDLSEQLKVLRAPYAERKKYQTAIVQYATCLIERAGK